MLADFKQLESWLHSELKPLCVADPIPLSQYVIALLKKDKPEQELKDICIDQLEVFLQENTSIFVKELFHVLKTKSYISVETTKAISSVNSISKDSNEKVNEQIKGRKRHLSTTNNASDLLDSSNLKQKRKCSPSSKTISQVCSRSPIYISSNSLQSKQKSTREHESVLDVGSGEHKENNEENSEKLNLDENNYRSNSGLSGRRNKHHDMELRKRESREHFRSHDRDSYASRSRNSNFRSSSSHRVSDGIFGGSRHRACRDFERTGFCAYGNKCYYDHDSNNLVVSSTTVTGVTTTQITSSLINSDILDSGKPSPTNSTDELSPKCLGQPQSVVSAVLSNTMALNPILSALNTVVIPVYRPTPIQTEDEVIESYLQLNNDDDIVDDDAKNNNKQISFLQPVWKIDRIQSQYHHNYQHQQQQQQQQQDQHDPNRSNYHHHYQNHYRAPVSISKNIVPIPMVENVNNVLLPSTLVTAPPAYEPDHPHISMVSPTNGILQAQIVHGCETNENLSALSLSYTPSPISEQKSRSHSNFKANDTQKVGTNQFVKALHTTLYIHRIPWRFNEAEKIHEHFSQFGNVINVVPKYRGLSDTAMVEFSSSDEAEKAYRSPVPMFSNRFIRITTWFQNRDNQNHKQRKLGQHDQTGRCHQPRNILDRLGTRPVRKLNDNANPYAWLSLSSNSDNATTTEWSKTGDADSNSKGGGPGGGGGRSRWRLERNSTNDNDDNVVLSGDDEEDETNGELVTFDNRMNYFSHKENGLSKAKYQSDDDYMLGQCENSNKPNYKSSTYLQSRQMHSSHKQETDALIWERRKIAALKHRQEQLNLLDKARKARDAAITAKQQHISHLTIQLKNIMQQLDPKKSTNPNDDDLDLNSQKVLTISEKQKLLSEAKRLHAELEAATADVKICKGHNVAGAKKVNGIKIKGSTAISAAALQALPDSLRQERQKQIDEIQTELQQMSNILANKISEDGEDVIQNRRRIVELKRQLVELETIRLSDLAFSSSDSTYGLYPSRTQTKLDKRPRTLFITGVGPDDVDNFQRALSLNYLHTQNLIKHTDSENNKFILEITFCTRDFAEAAMRQFSKFNGQEIQMSFLHPTLSNSKANASNDEDTKHVSSTQMESSEQQHTVSSSQCIEGLAYASPTSTSTMINLASDSTT